AIPGAEAEADFEPRQIDAVMRKDPLIIPPQDGAKYYVGLDTANGGSGGNAATMVIATSYTTREPVQNAERITHVQIVRCHQWLAPFDTLVMIDEAINIAKSYGRCHALADQHAGGAIESHCRKRAFHLEVMHQGQKNKIEMFDRLRILVQSKTIELPPDPVVRQDLLGVRRRIT